MFLRITGPIEVNILVDIFLLIDILDPRVFKINIEYLNKDCRT